MLAAETCAMCPKMCRFACPVARALDSDAVHPTGLGTAVVAAARDGDWARAAAVVYDCTLCLGCRTYCELDQDVPAYVREARAQVVRAGIAPPAVTAVEEAGRALGWPSADAARAMDAPNVQTGSADVAYVTTCSTTPEIARAVIGVSTAAKLRVAVVRESCCGAAFEDLGLTDLAATARERTATAIATTGAACVVTDDAACAGATGGVPFAVFAAELVDADALRPARRAGRVVYHDPCALGRGLGVYDEPRRVLEALYEEVVEPFHHRATARCCGAGGGFDLTNPDGAEAVARERAAELRATGADVIVTAGTRCRQGLRHGGIDVKDLAEVLAEAL